MLINIDVTITFLFEISIYSTKLLLHISLASQGQEMLVSVLILLKTSEFSISA